MPFFAEASKSYYGEYVAASFLSALFNQLYIYVAMMATDRDSNGPATASTYLHLSKEEMLKRYAKMSLKVERLQGKEQVLGDVKIANRLNTLDFTVDVLKLLYNLRPVEKSQNQNRENFLKGVVALAKAILGQSKWTHETGVPTHCSWYLKTCELNLNIQGFFSLCDGITSKGKEADNCQFLFGLDEFGNLDLLIKNDSRQPQGIRSFIRVFHDLELMATESLNKSSTSPLRRVWLVTLDTTSNSKLLPKDGQIYASEQAMDQWGHISSIFHSFGFDHNLKSRMRLKQNSHELMKSNENYFASMTLDQLHGFAQLQLMGRGIWAAYRTPRLMLLAVKKILLETLEWESLRLFKKRNASPNASAFAPLSQASFAVAALRFNLDQGIAMSETGNAYQFIKEAIARHMRILVQITDSNFVFTATPSEPVLAMGAVLLLNYGYSFLKPYRDSILNQRNVKVNFIADRNDDS